MRSQGAEEPRQGQGLRRITTICAFIVLASAGLASQLEQRVRDGSLDRITALLNGNTATLAVPARRPEPLRAELRQTTLDYEPTGSVPVSLAAPVVLDPCTGQRK